MSVTRNTSHDHNSDDSRYLHGTHRSVHPACPLNLIGDTDEDGAHLDG